MIPSSPHPCPAAPRSVLSLDVSSVAVGWATWAAQERASGVLDLKGISDLWVKRADLYSRWLTAKLAERKPDLIVIEQPFGGMANGSESVAIMGYLHRQTHVIGYRLAIHVRDVTRAQVVKALLGWSSRPADPNHVPRKGSGRPKMRGATKREVMQAVNARHGTRITSDDQADAVAALDLVLSELAGTGLPGSGMSIFAPSQDVKKTDMRAADHGEMVPLAHGESLPLAPARQQLHAAQAAIPLDQMQAPARRQLERALADMGIGDPRLPRPARKARGRRRATA
jgi:hypothetical protein